jgi:hypothetical protein
LNERRPMIKLRRLELSDLDAVHALISRMDVVRHMLLPLCSREERAFPSGVDSGISI